jgi:preprotein translocase subunit SecD
MLTPADQDEGFTLSPGSSPKPRATGAELRPAAEHHHLRNRVNELGVAEPVIQQQGRPHRGAAAGCAGHGQGQGHPRPHRDAGSPHGRRAADRAGGALEGQVPFGTELYVERDGTPLLVRNEVVLTGDRS